MKKTQVNVRRKLENRAASPVVTFPTPTVTSVRRPLVNKGATVSPTRPVVRGNSVSIRRGVTDKSRK